MFLLFEHEAEKVDVASALIAFAMADQSLHPLAGIRIDNLDKTILRFPKYIELRGSWQACEPYAAGAFGNIGNFVVFVDVAYGRFGVVLG